MPRKEGGRLKEFLRRRGQAKKRRWILTRDRTYFSCPVCGTRVTVKRQENEVIVFCPRCRVGLKLPAVEIAEDLDYAVAYFDYIMTGGKFSGIFTNEPRVEEVTVTDQFLDSLEKSIERKRKLIVSDEVIQKILSLQRFTSADVANLLGVEPRYARKIIRALRDEGLVRVAEQVGSRKIWEVVRK